MKVLADGWLLRVESTWVYGYRFCLNDAAADRLCDDKAATYEALMLAGVPAVEHQFLTIEKLDLEDLKKRLAVTPLVIKPNDGTGGENVVRVTRTDELQQELKRLFKNSERLAISSFLDIQTEYRAIVLDGVVELLYAKHLVDNNDWKFNLGQGANAEVLSADTELEKLAVCAVAALQIRFASVDIVELVDGSYKILEINSGVMMEHFSALSNDNYVCAKKIYKKALEKAMKPS